MLPSQYSPVRYFSAFKEVRNKLRKFTPHSVLSECVGYLQEPVPLGRSEVEKMPWISFLLIKWAYIDEQALFGGKSIATRDQVVGLLNMVLALADHGRMPDEYPSLRMFMRTLAFQQFPYQASLDGSHFGRQALMFESLDKNHKISRQYQQLTGLNIQQTLALLALISGKLINIHRSARHSLRFDGLIGAYGADKFGKLMSILAVEPNSLRNFLLENCQKTRTHSEYCEQTPFFSRPFLRVGMHDYLCLHPQLFYRAAEYLVHDKLKEDDNDSFMAKFGILFEDYVRKALHYSGAAFVQEDEIERLVPAGVKVTDFVITEENANVFIDAKGVELSETGRTTHLQNVLKDRLKTSIIKAISQAVSLNTWLTKNQEVVPALNHRKNNYLLVVTYKQLFINNGSTLREMLGEEEFDSIAQSNASGAIPPEHMYFITIEELDIVVEQMRSKRVTLWSLLEKAKERDSVPDKQRFIFYQHLDAMGARALPAYIKDAKEKMILGLAESVGIPVPTNG